MKNILVIVAAPTLLCTACASPPPACADRPLPPAPCAWDPHSVVDVAFEISGTVKQIAPGDLAGYACNDETALGPVFGVVTSEGDEWRFALHTPLSVTTGERVIIKRTLGHGSTSHSLIEIDELRSLDSDKLYYWRGSWQDSDTPLLPSGVSIADGSSENLCHRGSCDDVTFKGLNVQVDGATATVSYGGTSTAGDYSVSGGKRTVPCDEGPYDTTILAIGLLSRWHGER